MVSSIYRTQSKITHIKSNQRCAGIFGRILGDDSDQIARRAKFFLQNDTIDLVKDGMKDAKEIGMADELGSKLHLYLRDLRLPTRNNYSGIVRRQRSGGKQQ